VTSRRFVHLPTEVEAVQWSGDYNDLPATWRSSGAFRYNRETGELTVVTGKGDTDVIIGDFVVHSGWEEYWPIAEPKFLASYRGKA
jgi:hypothetical protein